MKDNFEASLSLTLIYEGLFVNNPADPGGATMRGVTQAVYDEDRDSRNLPHRSVRLITDAELLAIYRWRYWDLMKCDAMPAGVDYVLFDYAVNSGVARAAKTLQRLLSIDQDGHMGSGTVTAALEFCQTQGATAVTDGVCLYRLDFLKSLKTFATFGKGWSRRVMGDLAGAQDNDSGVIDRALAMVNGDPVWKPINVTPTVKTYSAEARAA